MNVCKNLILGLSASICILSCSPTQSTAATEPARATENSAVRSNNSGLPVAHGMDFFKNYMDESYANLEKAVKGLTPEQLAFKPSEDKWSIAQCLEHIVLTEPLLFDYEKSAMNEPAAPGKRSEIKLTDDQVMTMMLDRSHKAQAPQEAIPTGKYTDYRTALNDLQAQRKLILKDVENYTIDDLRNHVTDGPMGPVDAYQFLLFIPGHTMRHTLQIQEVKADPNFPKN